MSALPTPWPDPARSLAHSHAAPRRVRRLARTSLARVFDVDCPGDDSRGEELAGAPELILVRRGVFAWRDRHGRSLLDAGTALFVPAGASYTVSHEGAGGDRCTVLELDPTLAEARRFDGMPPWRALAPHAHLLHRRLGVVAEARRAERDAGANPRALDELVARLLAVALAPPDAPGRRERTPAAPGSDAARRSSTRGVHRELADRVRRALARDPARAWSIAELATRVAAASPFHMCRVFRAEVGAPIHRYHTRLRLLAALDRWAEGGASDLTDAALELGFASHSHFTAAFRREFGVPPSRALARKRARS